MSLGIGDSSINPDAQIDNTTFVAAQSQTTLPSSGDEISQSELEQIVALMLSSWAPILVPPSDSANTNSVSGTSNGNPLAPDAIASLTLATNKKLLNIVDGMWDNFMKSIAELKEKFEKDQEKKDQHKKDFPEKGSAPYMQQLDANSRLDLLSSTFKEWLVKPAQGIDPISNSKIHSSNSSSSIVLGAPFLASTLATSTDFIREVIGQVNKGSTVGQMSVNPIADSLAPSISPGLHPDSQAAADLVAALLYGGVKLKSTIETLQQTPNMASPEDAKFALNFAQNILSIVTHNIEGEHTESKEGLHDSTNKLIRLQLLTMALNLLYRTQFGGMSGQELKGLLNGGSLGDVANTQEGKMMQQLVGAIKKLIPDITEDSIIGLMNYVDSKQSVSSMKDSYHLLTSQLAAYEKANISVEAVG